MQRRFLPFKAASFQIVPHGHEFSLEEGTPIILGTKGAFGSGEHETTAACLELIPNVLDISGGTVIDLGCGTGILSISAAICKADAITAIDIDDAAIASTIENCIYNGVEEKITPLLGVLDDFRLEAVDFFIANIYADILLDLSDRIASLTKDGGYLLLSGIPLQDKYDIVCRYENLGFTVSDSRIGEDFATYLFAKRG